MSVTKCVTKERDELESLCKCFGEETQKELLLIALSLSVMQSNLRQAKKQPSLVVVI